MFMCHTLQKSEYLSCRIVKYRLKIDYKQIQHVRGELKHDER